MALTMSMTMSKFDTQSLCQFELVSCSLWLSYTHSHIKLMVLHLVLPLPYLYCHCDCVHSDEFGLKSGY